MRMLPDFFGMATTGLAHGDVECWTRPAATNLSTSVHLLGGRNVDAVGPRRDGRAVRRNRNLKGKQRAGAKVR